MAAVWFLGNAVGTDRGGFAQIVSHAVSGKYSFFGIIGLNIGIFKFEK